MLSVLSCRGSDFSSDTFGPHTLAGGVELFAGGPTGQPILVHGYNCPEPHVLKTYASFAEALGCDCMVYSWPSGCHPLDFLPAVGRATIAGALGLRDVFTMRHLRQCCDSVITHSLGARVALTALKGGSFGLKNLILMGAAVDWDVFEPGGEFADAPSCCRAIHILYSNHDEVLKFAFPAGDLHGDHRALGLDGPHNPQAIAANIVLHDVSDVISCHEAYLTAAGCAELVRKIMAEEEGFEPPSEFPH